MKFHELRYGTDAVDFAIDIVVAIADADVFHFTLPILTTSEGMGL